MSSAASICRPRDRLDVARLGWLLASYAAFIIVWGWSLWRKFSRLPPENARTPSTEVRAQVTHRLLADLIVLVHGAFVVFVVLGGLLVFWRWRWVWVHLPAAIWGAWIEFSGRICPLTPLENHFRQLAGERGYAGGFIEHYLIPLMYPVGLTRDTQFFLGLIVVAINVIVYAVAIRRVLKSRVRDSVP